MKISHGSKQRTAAIEDRSSDFAVVLHAADQPEITTGAENRTRPGEYDRSHARVLARHPDGREDGSMHRLIDRVPAIGSIESQGPQ
jgi:hypothetical protein